MLSALQQSNGYGRGSEPTNRIAALVDRFFQDDLVATRSHCAVPLSMWEDEDNYHIEVDVPGMTENDIEISVQQGDLLISGERKAERKQGGYDTRTYGRFVQRISLPSLAKTEQVDAKIRNGVLSLAFPKGDEAKPRKIAIRSE